VTVAAKQGSDALSNAALMRVRPQKGKKEKKEKERRGKVISCDT
jgi:hypothetical protein